MTEGAGLCVVQKKNWKKKQKRETAARGGEGTTCVGELRGSDPAGGESGLWPATGQPAQGGPFRKSSKKWDKN